jgi:hypothetical protein
VILERYTLVIGADLSSWSIERRPIGIGFKGILVAMSGNIACTSFVSVLKPSSTEAASEASSQQRLVEGSLGQYPLGILVHDDEFCTWQRLGDANAS